MQAQTESGPHYGQYANQPERLSNELNLTEVRPRARARREDQSRFG